MAHYKLTYFEGRGRAELARLIFAAAGVAYDDVRITWEDWPKLKPSTPFGQLPILEINGKTYGQSIAFARYLARKYKLAGKTAEEELEADMLIDCLEDLLKPLTIFHWAEKDETKKAELKKKFAEEQLPASLTLVEKLLKSNHGGDGFFVGDQLTWADLAYINIVPWLAMVGLGDAVVKHPKLKAHQERIEKIPKVAEWLAKRPASEF